jgi:hypothetical protein
MLSMEVQSVHELKVCNKNRVSIALPPNSFH